MASVSSRFCCALATSARWESLEGWGRRAYDIPRIPRAMRKQDLNKTAGRRGGGQSDRARRRSRRAGRAAERAAIGGGRPGDGLHSGSTTRTERPRCLLPRSVSFPGRKKKPALRAQRVGLLSTCLCACVSLLWDRLSVSLAYHSVSASESLQSLSQCRLLFASLPTLSLIHI